MESTSGQSGTPELDQVADARRKLAAHADFPTTYWVVYGVALVAIAGIPIWMSVLGATGSPSVSLVLLAVAVVAATYSRIRRRRTGVYLPKRISSYPSAMPWWVASLVATAVGFAGLQWLVGDDQRGTALLVLPVVAVVVFTTQYLTRSAMRRDVEEGRVRP